MADKYVKAGVAITALEKEIKELRAYKKAVKKRAEELWFVTSLDKQETDQNEFIKHLASDEFGEVIK